jgi:hypothetical protein
MLGQMPQHRRARGIQPFLAVDRDPGLLRIGRHPPAFVVRHPVTGPRLNEAQVFCAHHPQRATHREVLDQRAALVKLGIQIGDGNGGQARPQ